jgi:hypothetical protein
MSFGLISSRKLRVPTFRRKSFSRALREYAASVVVLAVEEYVPFPAPLYARTRK